MGKVVVLLNKPIAFLTFSLWPDLKIPNVFKTCVTDQKFLEQTVFNDIGKQGMRKHPVSREKPILSVLMKVAKKRLCHKHAASLKPTYQTPIFWAGKICLSSLSLH